ncbi:MAG: methyltransferase domain-containing protein [Burkholderiaceae bacterium]|nr:methyltransferase domain-containing protein [Burkholderiaceae bacterium]
MTEETAPIVELAEWLRTPPGLYAAAWQQARIDAIVADVFGYHALQVGLVDWDLLDHNRIPFKAYASAVELDADSAVRSRPCVLADPAALPFESQSIDLLVLPHVFDCTATPHAVLREVERVLMPEGRVVISGFNPWSLWGVRNVMPAMEQWLPRPASALVSVPRLRDWLKLMSFEVDPAVFGCFAPAVRSDTWLDRWAFMEQYGPRWWSVCGSVYVVTAVKRVAGMRMIKPTWKRRRKRRGARAVQVALPRNLSNRSNNQ